MRAQTARLRAIEVHMQMDRWISGVTDEIGLHFVSQERVVSWRSRH